MARPSIPQEIRAALQGSGFPFQTAVAYVVRTQPSWQVHASEFPWQDPAGNGQFLDLVATTTIHDTKVFLAIECKKTQKDMLNFLRPLGACNTGKLLDVRCLRAQIRACEVQPIQVFCETWNVVPASFEAEFCVVSTSPTGRDQRLLERDAALVVRATDAFVRDFWHRRPPVDVSSCFFLPVIVTNAPIYTSRYRADQVSLDTGEFTALPTDIEQVEMMRFRKAFHADRGRDLGDRSVLVVDSRKLAEFLELIQLDPQQPSDHLGIPAPQRRFDHT